MPRSEWPIRWSPEAEADLLEIWRWGAQHFSSDIADKHLREIDKAASNLR